ASILAAGDKHAAANTNRLLRYSHGCWKLVLRLLCEVGRGHNRGNTRVLLPTALDGSRRAPAFSQRDIKIIEDYLQTKSEGTYFLDHRRLFTNKKRRYILSQ